MHIDWNPSDPAPWMDLHGNAVAALQQDWHYGEAMRVLGTQVLRALITDGGTPIGIAQCLVRRVGGVFGLALCTHGPVWSDRATPSQRQIACRLLRRTLPQSWPRLLLITPDATEPAQAGLSGRPRVMTGHATVRLDLTQGEQSLRAAMNGKWRNRLAAAERSALTVHRVGSKPAQYRWLLERELAQRQSRRYIALPDGFVEAWQAQGGRMLTLRADLGRDAVAGMLFLIHGQAASYQIGWVGDGGRDLGAHNRLLWQGMLELGQQGVRQLDLGGVDTGRGAGLARFKIGTGGDVMTLAGTYL